MNTVKELRKRYLELRGVKNSLESLLKDSECTLQDKGVLYDNIQKALVLTQETAQMTQEEIRYHLCDIVSMALKAVFPEPYEFNIDFEIKRGKTEAVIYIQKEDGKKIDPMTESGGGVVDVCSFAFRLACMEVSKSNKVLIMDEPFRFVSTDLQCRIGDTLKLLSDKLKYQFIIVTHEVDTLPAYANKEIKL